MKKFRTAGAVLAGCLAVLAVPAAAQAHHTDFTASCVQTGAAPVITYKTTFVGFSTNADPAKNPQKTVNGTVKVDGVAKTTVVNSTVTPGNTALVWSGNNSSVSNSIPANPGQTYTLVSDFTWNVNGTVQGEKEPAKTVKCPNPAITLVKDGAATSAGGAPFTYTFVATNTGDVTLVNVTLTDDKCAPLVPAAGEDATLAPGETANFTCTTTAPAAPAAGSAATEVVNVAKVCGDYVKTGEPTTTVCDEDPHTFTVPPLPPTDNPPTDNPPTTTPPTTTPPTATPDTGGDVLPETIVSGRAALRGPSGCVKTAFRARVNGRAIASVKFYVDGKLVKSFGAGRSEYSIKVRPSKYGFGRHRVVARVTFTAESGTSARRLPLTFRRCAQGAVAPRFTG